MNRSKTKFTWAIVLPILLAIIFGIVSFLGTNFLNISNEKVWGMSHAFGCVIIATVIAILLGGTSTVAILLKRTSGNFKTCFVWEVIFLIFFVVFSVFFTTKTSPFPHFFTVMAKKADIQSKLQTSIKQAENMFAAYESYAENRKNLYKNKLKRVVAAERTDPNTFTKYSFKPTGDISGITQIDKKMFTVHADLFPTNFSDTTANKGIKEVATEWLQNAKNVTNSPVWIIGIADVVNDIDKKSNEWLNTLVSLSQVREQGEQASDFEYPLGFENVKNNFTKLESPTSLSIGLAVLVYLLMLLSWFGTKRSTKIGSLKYLISLFFPSRSHKEIGDNKSNSKKRVSNEL